MVADDSIDESWCLKFLYLAIIELGMINQKWFNFSFSSEVLFSALPVQFGTSQENIAAHVIEIIVYKHSEELSQLQDLYFSIRRTFLDIGGYKVVRVYFNEFFDEETVDVFFGLAFEIFHEIIIEGDLHFIIL